MLATRLMLIRQKRVNACDKISVDLEDTISQAAGSN